MKRLEMLKHAVKLAHETVDGNSALNDATYDRLKEIPDDEAVNKLAFSILEEAYYNLES